MKRIISASLFTALVFGALPFMAITTLAAQNPSYSSVYYYDDELLEEFGSSEVLVPYTEDAEGLWTEVDNSFKFLMIDGTLEKDAKIFTEAGFTLVPIRLVSDKLGAVVDYSPADKKITIKKDDKSIVLASGEYKALVNGKEEQLEAAVKNVDGTTYVPIRFIVENLGGVADYVSYKPSVIPAFPTVSIESAEFTAQPKMADEEALELAREKLLDAYTQLESSLNSYEYPDKDALEKNLAELKTDLENVKISGKYVSCYLMLETNYCDFLVNTVNGDLFTSSTMTFFHSIKPFDFYDVGNAYFYN